MRRWGWRRRLRRCSCMWYWRQMSGGALLPRNAVVLGCCAQHATRSRRCSVGAQQKSPMQAPQTTTPRTTTPRSTQPLRATTPRSTQPPRAMTPRHANGTAHRDRDRNGAHSNGIGGAYRPSTHCTAQRCAPPRSSSPSTPPPQTPPPQTPPPPPLPSEQRHNTDGGYRSTKTGC